MRSGGFTILTDPNLVHRHEKVGLGKGPHATRLTDPAMEPARLAAMRVVDPGMVVPVHHAEYDVFTSSVEDLLEAAEAAPLRAKVRPLTPGETWELPPAGTPAGLW